MKLLYKCIVGSRLYGFNTPDSDTDIKGFGLPEPDQLLGLNHWEQTREVDPIANTDSTIFALKKFFLYCLKGNPTILEVAFADDKFALYTTPLGEEVRKYIRENFISKEIFKSYSAYFRAQVRKLGRPDREGKRQPLIDKYGYDVKFTCHAYRLGVQCIEVMQNGTISPTLSPDLLKVCVAIRNGEYSLEAIKPILEQLDKAMYIAYEKSNLRTEPNFAKANEFLTNIQTKYIKEEYNV